MNTFSSGDNDGYSAELDFFPDDLSHFLVVLLQWNYHADVDDSVESQVYHNMEAQPETDAAVAETEGKIITCGGEPIQAYFFSTSCGKTSTDEVWNTAETAEYLKSVTVGGEKQEPETEEAFASFITKRDSTSLEVEDGWYRWQVTIPADVLSERAADQKIGEITGIEVRGF